MCARRATAEPASKDGRVALSVRLEPEVYEALRQLAFDKRVTMLSLIAEGVELVLKKHGPQRHAI